MAEEESTAIVQMEKMDEAQIVESVKGMLVSPKYFYELPGNQVGISWAGIKKLAQVMSDAGRPISITELREEEREDRIIVSCVAKLMTTGERRYGTSDQTKLMEVYIDSKDHSKGKKSVDDPFCRQKAYSKAQRNAIRNHLDEVVIGEAYKVVKSGGKLDAKVVGHSDAKAQEPKKETTVYDGTKLGQFGVEQSK